MYLILETQNRLKLDVISWLKIECFSKHVNLQVDVWDLKFKFLAYSSFLSFI